MKTVIHNCKSQNPIDDTITKDEKSPLKKKIEPFNHLIFFYSVFAFSLFYVFLWIIEDKTDLAKTSTLFTYANSIVNTICWLLYYFTENSVFLIHGIASLIVSLLAELYYGSRYFPEYMYLLSTYIHHFVFLTFISTGFLYDSLQYSSLVMIIEFPTFLLNHKRRYNINSSLLNGLFGISFFLLRILFWCWLFFIHPILSKIHGLKIPSACVLGVFVYWFILWIKKQW